MSATLIPKRAACAAVDRQIQVGLAEIAQQFHVMHSRDALHDSGDFLTLPFKNLQIVAEDLERERSLLYRSSSR